MSDSIHIDFSRLNLARLANNYLHTKSNGEHTTQEINLLNGFVEDVLTRPKELPSYKVGVLMVCINENYWRYLRPLLTDIKERFLPGHTTDVLLWSDIKDSYKKRDEIKRELQAAQNDTEIITAVLKSLMFADSIQTPLFTSVGNELATRGIILKTNGAQMWIEITEEGKKHVAFAKEQAEQILSSDPMEGINARVFETEPVQWPLPTLMRYNLFLSEEEELKKYDYLFYIDVDMRIVDMVGDEIMGDGLTMAQHPMYALRPNLYPPYEPNPESAAYFKQFGRVVNADGKLSFQPLYAAGGFQGGTTASFIDAMKTMKEGTDKDFQHNYMARWNDESHWNKYLFDHTPSVVLSPSYVYPDSLIEEYYKPLWGRNYKPRIVTLTKPFTTSKEGGAAVQQTLTDLKKMQ